MEHTYQYSWIIPFVPLPIPMLIGVGLLLFPMATKYLHCIWAFPSIFFFVKYSYDSFGRSIYSANK